MLASRRFGRVAMHQIEWDQANPLRTGEFGTVYPGTLRAGTRRGMTWPDTPVVVQVLGKIRDMTGQRQFLRDIEMLSHLEHPCIANFVTFALDPNHFEIVTERGVTDLSTVIQSERRGIPYEHERANGTVVEWDNTRRVICAIGTALGLGYIHANNVVHRNLKPENIMLDENLHPKLSDFGISQTMPRGRDLEAVAQIETPLYMAPELFSDDVPELTDIARGKAVDVYAYGMFLYEVWTGSRPWLDARQPTRFNLVRWLVNGDRPVIPDDVPEAWSEVMQRCWEQDPSHRPTMREVVLRLRELDEFIPHDADNEAIREIRDYCEPLMENLLPISDP